MVQQGDQGGALARVVTVSLAIGKSGFCSVVASTKNLLSVDLIFVLGTFQYS